MAPWMMATETGENKVQPNLLAWLEETNALRWACHGDDEDLVRFLLSAGIAPNENAIVQAAAKAREKGDLRVLGLLLDAGWDINKPIRDGTPILGAFIRHPNLVSWCLSRGADPNAPSGSATSRTIMEFAAAYASPATVRLLVEEHGASVTGGSLVAHASMVHAEISPPVKNPKPSSGTEHGRLEVARFLLDAGAPVDAYHLQNRGDDGGRPQQQERTCCGLTEAVLFGQQNALHFAAWGGRTDMVRLLLERGADRTAPTCSMWTDNATLSPLEFALKYGQDEVADLLREA
ncbi:hypothetical protein GGTG_03543 [Gaeumannomyces tritici R3-111a-1]|uniref:Uncharacterized protein n=1 Tax=Gaeumannomyces tritici (strain R3-111a-1) TaxID=644352 RepID=J3NQI7_GAET3|nr:hypothetical protein GGTG_03543 [Gaeumannomyces tritici R3-111a-1]EJT78443.1 hypothetical protein GGTG_03543 [Gaeumannomyces tritici R3-111a-1]